MRAGAVVRFLLPTLATVALLAIGGAAGYYLAVHPLRSLIQAHSGNETLEGLLDDEKRASAARAYYRQGKTAEQMGDFSWVPPNVPTPFVGHGLRPGRSGNALVNTAQLRADHEVALPKPPGVYRVFLTGGSTAYGSGAPAQEKTIAGYLEAILNRELAPRTALNYEVLTAAVPGWSSTHERIMIEQRLSEMAPDLVVSLSGNNDVHYGYLKRDVLWSRAYGDEFYFRLIDAAYRAAGFGRVADPVALRERIPAETVAENLEKNVRLGWYALSLKGVPYVFLLQPSLSVSRKALSDRERHIQPAARDYFLSSYALIDSRLRNLHLAGFGYRSLADAFDHLGAEDEIFLDSYHFGDRGNEIVARRIAALLENLP